MKLGVKKVIPIDRLIKAKYQDNLEFLQWMYAFFQNNYNGDEYDAEKRRSMSKGGSAATKVRTTNNRPRSHDPMPHILI